MSFDHRFRTSAFISSTSSAIQALILCILGCLGFLSYSCYLQVQIPTTWEGLTYKHYLASYFQGNSCQPDLVGLYPNLSPTTTAQKLLLLNVFVFTFNFFLFFASGMLIFALWTEKKHLTFGWTMFYVMIKYCVAFVDIVAVGIFAVDYGNVQKTTEQYPGQGMEMLTLLTLIFIAARGFYIWFANISFTVYLSGCLCRFAGCGKRKDFQDIDLHNRTKGISPNENTFNPYEQSCTNKIVFPPPHSALARWGGRLFNTRSPNSQPSRNQGSVVKTIQVPCPASQPVSSTREVLRSVEPRPHSLEEAIRTMKPLRRLNK